MNKRQKLNNAKPKPKPKPRKPRKPLLENTRETLLGFLSVCRLKDTPFLLQFDDHLYTNVLKIHGEPEYNNELLDGINNYMLLMNLVYPQSVDKWFAEHKIKASSLTSYPFIKNVIKQLQSDNSPETKHETKEPTQESRFPKPEVVLGVEKINTLHKCKSCKSSNTIKNSQVRRGDEGEIVTVMCLDCEASHIR